MSASLSQDLVSIRKELNLSSRDVYEKTRIPLDVIEEIENGFIFSDQCERNPTYIRSFVRTYAKAIKISDTRITAALDLQDRGAYNGFLASGDEAPDLPAEKPSPSEPISRFDYDKEYSRPDPTRPHNLSTPPPPSLGSINWANLGSRFSSVPSNVLRPLLVALVVLVAAALIYLGISMMNGDAEVKARQEIPEPKELLTPSTNIPESEKNTSVSEELQREMVTPTNSVLQSDSADVVTRFSGSLTSLPDTLTILVHAATEKLEPVRVRTDVTGMINPYWIEKGQAMRFDFTRFIYIRGQFGRMQLIFNGQLINNLDDIKKEDGSVELDRSFFESDSRYLNIEPLDDLNNPPRSILQRPSFPVSGNE